MQHGKQIFLWFCGTMLVFSIDIGLVIMFFKVFEKIEIEVSYVLYKKTTFC